MKLEKIYAKAKEFLEGASEKELKKKKVKELKEKIEDKISKMKKEAKEIEDEVERQNLKNEIVALKNILDKLKKDL
ncbi:MAG: hypothetical protein M0P43_06125 [Arcobacteraceae bacterium]|nr:hypothetical protein [Arcobacteraceae bacterium]